MCLELHDPDRGSVVMKAAIAAKVAELKATLGIKQTTLINALAITAEELLQRMNDLRVERSTNSRLHHTLKAYDRRTGLQKQVTFARGQACSLDVESSIP